MDIRGYFMNIERQRLLYIVFHTLDAKYGRKSTQKGKRWGEVLDYELVKYLCMVIILNDPLHECVRRGKPDDWRELPPTKSLFCSKPGFGLPIGNLTSQLFSNVYLNGLDQLMKHQCGCRHYGRYVDDFYVVSRNKKDLQKAKEIARHYLVEQRCLQVHPDKTVVRSVFNGVDFLGAYLKPHRMYVRNSTMRKMNCKINVLKDQLPDYSP